MAAGDVETVPWTTRGADKGPLVASKMPAALVAGQPFTTSWPGLAQVRP